MNKIAALILLALMMTQKVISIHMMNHMVRNNVKVMHYQEIAQNQDQLLMKKESILVELRSQTSNTRI